MVWFALFVAGVVFAVGARWLWRAGGRRRGWRRVAIWAPIPLVVVLAGVGFAGGGYVFWYMHRGQPAAERRGLFRGVEYQRDVRRSPRPMVVHVVRVDLGAPGVRFLVTPPGGAAGHELAARKTTRFLREFKCQVAINANYFYPFRSNSPWDYVPRSGEGVDLCGFAASRGVVYSNKRWRPGTLYVSADNRASFEEPVGEVYNAVSGNGFLVRGGTEVGPPADEEDRPYPRAALGLDAGARTMLLVVIDGKQPGYSEGATLAELAGILRGLGAWDAIRLDEGGSCALAVEEPGGRAGLLNVPINNRIPFRERVVANHLGVFAERE